MAIKKYFFNNISSNALQIIPVDDVNAGTISAFKYTPALIESCSSQNFPYQYYQIGLVVVGDLKTAEINLEVSPDEGTTWIAIDGFNFVASDVTYSKINGSPMPIMKLIDGLFYNLKHRIRIVNVNADSLQNISIYILMY